MMMKQPISAYGIALTLIGAVIGAGFASGQEIWQFFCIHGSRARFGVLAAVAVFYCLLLLIAQISRKYNIRSYDRLIELLAGSTIGPIFKHLFALLLWSGLTVMLAGSTVMAKTVFSTQGWPVTVLTAVTVFLVTYYRVSGLAKANELLIPFLIFLLCFFFIRSLVVPGTMEEMPISNKSWLLSAILYVAFNSAVLLVVTPSLTLEADRKSVVRGIAFACAGLCTLLLGIAHMLQKYWAILQSAEMPMLTAAQYLIPAAPWLYSILLWIALITTAFASALGIVQYLNMYSNRPNHWMLGILVVSGLLAQHGFANLVGLLYPAMGYVCLAFYLFCCGRYCLLRLASFLAHG